MYKLINSRFHLRLRQIILLQTLISNGLPLDTSSVIAGLSNDYTHYVATFEEYQVWSECVMSFYW